MGSFSIWHWLIVLAVVLILFGGGGKISKIMGDMAKGVKAFKSGLKDDEEHVDAPPKSIPSGGATVGTPGPASAGAESAVHRDDAARG